jgi:cytochrome c5
MSFAADEAAAKATYEQFCIICHKDGLVGAPRFGDEKDWKPRLSGKTLDDLLAVAKKGLNAMPPQGTCTECSDEDLKAAIQYMLPRS